MALLNIEGLTKHFGGLAAVDNVCFQVRQENILSVIGPNGAGKTTVFNLITGFLKPTAGKVFFEGNDITGRKTHDIAKLGIIRTFQITKLFPALPVIENVKTASQLSINYGLLSTLINSKLKRDEESRITDASEKILQFVGLHDEKQVAASNLPHGHQRLLEIGIALASKPKLLLLDEPATGMNLEEIKVLMELILRIRDLGITILLVEHNMKLVMNISDEVVVLNYGKKIAEGSPKCIRVDRNVVESYLGKGFA